MYSTPTYDYTEAFVWINAHSQVHLILYPKKFRLLIFLVFSYPNFWTSSTENFFDFKQKVSFITKKKTWMVKWWSILSPQSYSYMRIDTWVWNPYKIKMNFCFKTLIIFALGKSHNTKIKVCAMKRKDDTIIATSD